MTHRTVVIVLIIVTIVYIAAMAILFWRYRVSMRQLSEKLRQCDAKQKEAEAQAQDEIFEKL